MKSITIRQFNAKCLRFINEVGEGMEPLVITKYGKPYLQLMPVTREIDDVRQKLLGSILFEKDILSPIGFSR